MENALLILHLVLVVALIIIVLIQRSEGGALGMGGGGGGLVSGRGAATALQKVTWYIAAGFIATSLALTIMATTSRQSGSVFDGLPSVSGDTFNPPAGGSGEGSGDGEGTFTPPVFAPPTIDGASSPETGTSTPSGAAPTPAAPVGSQTEPGNLIPAPADQ